MPRPRTQTQSPQQINPRKFPFREFISVALTHQRFHSDRQEEPACFALLTRMQGVNPCHPERPKPQSGARLQPTSQAVGKHKAKTTSRKAAQDFSPRREPWENTKSKQQAAYAAKDNSPGLQSWESEKKKWNQVPKGRHSHTPAPDESRSKRTHRRKNQAAKRRKISAHGASRGKTQSQNNKPRSARRDNSSRTVSPQESEKKNGTKSRRDGTATPTRRPTNQRSKRTHRRKNRKAAKRRKISAHGASRGKTQSQNNQAA